MSYQESIDYLFGLQRHGIKLGLENSFTLMGLMGNPHDRFRSLHIAVTNGKGSTAAFLASMLSAAGLRTGLYTSPHLVSFTERIRINNVTISEKDVVELAERIRTVCERVSPRSGSVRFSPTFFEVTTAMAFTYFAEQGTDIVVIEAGMGGRLDSTNVLTPLVSLITNIDLEHTEFLGTGLEQIAEEKAGIIKEGVPVITGAVQPGVIRVLEATARNKHAPLYRSSKDFAAKNRRRGPIQTFDYQGMSMQLNSLSVPLLGRYQIENASLALAALECIPDHGITVEEAAVRRGLEQIAWEGRLERVAEGPDIYVDGAHNPVSARMLSEAIEELKPSYGRLIFVIGILSDKDYRGMISAFASLADHIIVTKPSYSRAMDLAELAAETRRIHRSVQAEDSVESAIAAARGVASVHDCIVITGSLYVVGDARAFLKQDLRRAGVLNGLKG